MASEPVGMSRRKKFAFLLVGYAILFGVFELGTRGYFHFRDAGRQAKVTGNPQSIFLPHPFLAYTPNPARDDHTPEGFRGRGSYPRQHESLRIACFGGSSTYGTQVLEADSYPRQLERFLDEKLGRDVEVMNLGLAGYSTPNLLALLSLKIVHYEPQVAIFYVGWNDIWNRLYWPDFELDYSHALKAWEDLDFPWWRRSLFLDKLAALLGSVSPRDPHLHYVCWRPKNGKPDANWEASSAEPFIANLRSLSALCRAHGIKPVFVTQATDFEHHAFEPEGESVWPTAVAEYRSILLDLAAQEKVPVLDLAPQMSDRAEYFADVLHMSEAGNRERAHRIADFMEKTFPEHFVPGNP